VLEANSNITSSRENKLGSHLPMLGRAGFYWKILLIENTYRCINTFLSLSQFWLAKSAQLIILLLKLFCYTIQQTKVCFHIQRSDEDFNQPRVYVHVHVENTASAHMNVMYAFSMILISVKLIHNMYNRMYTQEKKF